MGSRDLALRETAIPFYANVWGYNRNEQSDQSIMQATNLGDLTNFASAGTLSRINAIRVLQPQWGDLIEANLNLKFTLASAEAARQLRIGIGNFSSGYTAQTSYTEAFIDSQHKLITGRTTPYSISAAGTFNQSKINLQPALYHQDDAQFVRDAFVLLLVFDQAPSTGSGWSFDKFEINCSAKLGLL